MSVYRQGPAQPRAITSREVRLRGLATMGGGLAVLLAAGLAAHFGLSARTAATLAVPGYLALLLGFFRVLTGAPPEEDSRSFLASLGRIAIAVVFLVLVLFGSMVAWIRFERQFAPAAGSLGPAPNAE